MQKGKGTVDHCIFEFHLNLLNFHFEQNEPRPHALGRVNISIYLYPTLQRMQVYVYCISLCIYVCIEIEIHALALYVQNIPNFSYRLPV
jgi:hypothetical protein